MKTELKYRTFDDLISEISMDFVIYNNEGMIEPAQLIKVAQRVNYDLGLRIHGTKNIVLPIANNKVKLPDDFYVANYAYLCFKEEVCSRVLSGRHTENEIVGTTNSGCSRDCTKCKKTEMDCNCQYTYVQECQNGENIFVKVVEKRKYEIRTFENFHRFEFSTESAQCDALERSYPTGYVKNNYIYTNIEKGDLFLSYQGAMEDDEGNLLVLDHPVINEYYEYAVKQRLLENLYISGEDVIQKLQLVELRLKAARNNALTIVNTPDFSEMYQLWKTNRKAMYGKYYDMFKSVEVPFMLSSKNPNYYDTGLRRM